MWAHFSEGNNQKRINGAKKQIKGKLREGWRGAYIKCAEANLVIQGDYLSVGENTEQTLSVIPYLS